MNAERRLRSTRAPHELDAERRAWEVARSAYSERVAIPRKRLRPGFALVPAIVVLAGVLALTPAGASVGRWLDRTLGLKHARQALFSLPTRGQILVAGPSGTWTVSPDGSKRRVGSWTDATWSPHALYVAVAERNELAALNRRGLTQWSIARPDVRFPRWFSPNGYRLAYLSGRTLRVIAGDGTGDRLLARGVTGIAPAWRVGHAYQLAYAHGDGTVVVRDADSGVIAWSQGVRPRPRMLAWSANGSRLLVLTAAQALVFDGSGHLLSRVSGAGPLVTGALSPDGRQVALVDHGELSVTSIAGSTHRVFALTGLRQLVWSPDGSWLLAGWPAADQWVFIHMSGRPRIIAVSRIAEQFGSAFPTLEGWCCTAGGSA